MKINYVRKTTQSTEVIIKINFDSNNPDMQAFLNKLSDYFTEAQVKERIARGNTNGLIKFAKDGHSVELDGPANLIDDLLEIFDEDLFKKEHIGDQISEACDLEGFGTDMIISLENEELYKTIEKNRLFSLEQESLNTFKQGLLNGSTISYNISAECFFIPSTGQFFSPSDIEKIRPSLDEKAIDAIDKRVEEIIYTANQELIKKNETTPPPSNGLVFNEDGTLAYVEEEKAELDTPSSDSLTYVEEKQAKQTIELPKKEIPRYMRPTVSSLRGSKAAESHDSSFAAAAQERANYWQNKTKHMDTSLDHEVKSYSKSTSNLTQANQKVFMSYTI